MGFSPVPRYAFRDATDISPGFLSKLGIRFLMLDLDNTIATYKEHSPADDIAQWAVEMQNCGVELYIVSNSTRKNRVEVFAETLGIDYIKGARKPSPNSILTVMEAKGVSAGESALVGDQIFTDAIAANSAGIISMVVRPRRLSNPILAIRYAIESPFRAKCRNNISSPSAL